MITLNEFDCVQTILGRKGKPRPQKHKFDFTGIIRCAECGCLYTAETKRKFIKSNSIVKEYTYYHCTRKTRRVNCSQKKVMRDDQLERLIIQEVKKYTIIPQFLEWAFNTLDIIEKENKEKTQNIEENQKMSLQKLNTELEELTRMRYRQLIDDSLYLKEKNEIEGKIERLKGNLNGVYSSTGREIELTKKAFAFSAYALSLFLDKRLEPRKELLITFSEDIKIADGIFVLTPYPWFIPIRDNYFLLEKEFKGLELNFKKLNTEQKEAVAFIRSRWRNIVNDVLNSIAEASQRGEYIHIPTVPP